MKAMRWVKRAAVLSTVLGLGTVCSFEARALNDCHPGTATKSNECNCPPGYLKSGPPGSQKCTFNNPCAGKPGFSYVGGKCVCNPPKKEIGDKCMAVTGETLPADAGKSVMLKPGTFTMGSDASGAEFEYPAHSVTLSSAFSLDIYEVSVKEYDDCVAAGVCPKPPPGGSYLCNYPTYKAHPMNCVTWDEAQTYCKFKGKRLPTEAEWEYAARATKSSKYPWGDAAPSCATIAMNGTAKDCESTTSTIGSHPKGKTAQGVHDLAGNVEEWMFDAPAYYKIPSTPVTDPAGPPQFGLGERVVKGGAFDQSATNVFEASHRTFVKASQREPWLGFRCAQGPEPKPSMFGYDKYTPKDGGTTTTTPPVPTTPPPVPTTPPPVPTTTVTPPAGNMIYIPPGTFKMGLGPGGSMSGPEHMVTLSAFYMDKFEVTVAEYRACVTAKACPAPYTGAGQICNYGVPGRDNHPVNCVEWLDADDYCKWAGKRLPSEAEWEYAAKGTTNNSYPWGNAAPTCSHAVITLYNQPACSATPTTMPVGSKPAGASPFGVMDMGGNVDEFVWDYYGPYTAAPLTNPFGPSSGTEYVIRGGHFKSDVGLNTWARWKVAKTHWSDQIGFRCAKNAK